MGNNVNGNRRIRIVTVILKKREYDRAVLQANMFFYVVVSVVIGYLSHKNENDHSICLVIEFFIYLFIYCLIYSHTNILGVTVRRDLISDSI